MRQGQAQNEREARWARVVLSVWNPLPTQTERPQVQEMPCMGLQRSMRKGCFGVTLLS